MFQSARSPLITNTQFSYKNTSFLPTLNILKVFYFKPKIIPTLLLDEINFALGVFQITFGLEITLA